MTAEGTYEQDAFMVPHCFNLQHWYKLVHRARVAWVKKALSYTSRSSVLVHDWQRCAPNVVPITLGFHSLLTTSNREHD
jgi:hypothetical protein